MAVRKGNWAEGNAELFLLFLGFMGPFPSLVSPKGNQPWIFTGRTDAKAEAPILWPPAAENWLRKDSNARKDWRKEENEMTEDDMVGWHHWLNGHEFEQALRVGDGQGSLVCCSPWSHKKWDMTEHLNWTEPFLLLLFFFFWQHHEAYGILVPRPEIQPTSPALKAQSLNHRATREALPLAVSWWSHFHSQYLFSFHPLKSILFSLWNFIRSSEGCVCFFFNSFKSLA